MNKNIENTLGYINVISALDTIFGKETYILHDIKTSEYDDFSMVVSIQDSGETFRIGIGDTRTEGMMHMGAGGRVGIDVRSDKLNFQGDYWESLEYCLENKEEANYIRYEGAVGANEQAIEKSFQILKKYLDNQKNVDEV